MGDNTFDQSGIKSNLTNKNLFIFKLNYFENNNLKIKKISCGNGFNLFLTGLNFFKKIYHEVNKF
jgi:hypothetical protein